MPLVGTHWVIEFLFGYSNLTDWEYIVQCQKKNWIFLSFCWSKKLHLLVCVKRTVCPAIQKVMKYRKHYNPLKTIQRIGLTFLERCSVAWKPGSGITKLEAVMTEWLFWSMRRRLSPTWLKSSEHQILWQQYPDNH